MQPWVSELQPLKRKDGQTLATALSKVMEGVLAAASLPCETRFVHVLVGDGIASNQVAHQLLWGANRGRVDVRYRLFAVTCSSHMANLCTRTALAGTAGRLARSDPLCCTCVRLYKYLLSDYSEEYAANLRDFVARRLDIVHPLDERLAGARHAHHVALELQQLYGQDMLPDSLLDLLNGSVSDMQHIASAAGIARNDIVGRVVKVLHKLCFWTEDRPVVTRFWLFAPTVYNLLRWNLLGLPADLLQPRAVNPRETNQKRAQAASSFLSNPSTPTLLRRCCLCL